MQHPELSHPKFLLRWLRKLGLEPSPDQGASTRWRPKGHLSESRWHRHWEMKQLWGKGDEGKGGKDDEGKGGKYGKDDEGKGGKGGKDDKGKGDKGKSTGKGGKGKGAHGNSLATAQTATFDKQFANTPEIKKACNDKRLCFVCGGSDHMSWECTQKDNEAQGKPINFAVSRKSVVGAVTRETERPNNRGNKKASTLQKNIAALTECVKALTDKVAPASATDAAPATGN